MRAPKEEAGRWERTLERYMVAHGIPLRWDGLAKRYTGIAGHLFARLNPKVEENMWANMPRYVRRYEQQDKNETGKQVVIFATNRNYGDSVDDSIVVMRLGTFAPMLKAFIQSDKERWSE
jgi:hypothetical protein